MRLTNEEFDLIVVGAGIAGLAVATSAAERNLRVVLIEKENKIGGSSTMSGGWFAFSETVEQRNERVEDSHALFRKDLLTVGKHLNDESLIDAYLLNQAAAYQWLKSKGIAFKELEMSSGQSVRRSHLSDIKEVLNTLFENYLAAGGTALFSAQAQRLMTSEHRVTGLKVMYESQTKEIESNYGVVLCSGGFSRGGELMKIFAPEQLSAIPFGGVGNHGDGLKMALQLGAGLADMAHISATYGSHPETSDQEHELLTAYYQGAIIVNQQGQRFIDESKSYKTLGKAVLEQPAGMGYQIFDAKVRAQSKPGVPLMDIDALEDVGHVYKGSSLQDLAHKIGVDAETLTETVKKYNSAVEGSQRDQFGRTSLCNGSGALFQIDAPPFYAYPAKALMTSTYCGITINPKGEVLDVFKDKIPGLYAAGEIVGGFHGAAYMTGTSLGKGLVFGHLIGRTVAPDNDRKLAAPEDELQHI